MKISVIHMQIAVHLHVNRTHFHMKDFALGLALKQTRKATRKWAIGYNILNPILTMSPLILVQAA